MSLTTEETFAGILGFLALAPQPEVQVQKVVRVEIDHLSTLVSRLYLVNPDITNILKIVDQLNTRDISEIVEYFNFTHVSFTVIGRLGIPQVVLPTNTIKPGPDQAGQFIIRRSIVLNTRTAVEAAYTSLAMMESEETTAQERVLMKQRLTDNRYGNCSVYSIEHLFDPRGIIKSDFVYDEATDMVVGLSDKMDGKRILHPSHPAKRREHYDSQLKKAVNSLDHKLGIRYVSESKRPLYVKAFGRVLRLVGKSDLPIYRAKKGSDALEQLTEYIEIAVIDNGEKEREGVRSYFTVAEARSLFGVFETEEQALEHGDYHKVAEKGLAEQEAKFKQDLKARLELEAAEHKRTIDRLNAEHELKLKELMHQQDLEIKRKVAEVEELHRQRELSVKKEESEMKLKEATVKHVYEVKSTETKIFSDSVKFGIAAVTGVLSLGIAVWKVFF
jgi:hypothetical protein